MTRTVLPGCRERTYRGIYKCMAGSTQALPGGTNPPQTLEHMKHTWLGLSAYHDVQPARSYQ